MSADTAAVLLVLAAAPAQTAFALFYSVTLPWWRTPIGRALFTKSWGLALLIDISLLYQWLGDNYSLRDVVRLTVYSLITVGAWLQLGAFLHERNKRKKEQRA